MMCSLCLCMLPWVLPSDKWDKNVINKMKWMPLETFKKYLRTKTTEAYQWLLALITHMQRKYTFEYGRPVGMPSSSLPYLEAFVGICWTRWTSWFSCTVTLYLRTHLGQPAVHFYKWERAMWKVSYRFRFWLEVLKRISWGSWRSCSVCCQTEPPQVDWGSDLV